MAAPSGTGYADPNRASPGMRQPHRIAGILLAILLAGCGTMHHFIPPAPIEPGVPAGTIGLSWSGSRFVPPALQASFYVGIAGRNLIGIGFNNFIFPTTLTYVHYEPIGDASYGNVQLHGSLTGIDPRYELDLGYAMQRGDVSHAFRLGIGYMGNLQPGLGSFQRPGCFGLVPIAGYDFRYGSLALAALIRPGLTRHVVRELAPEVAEKPDSGIVLMKDAVLAIELTDEAGLKISLRDSTFIHITPRENHYYEWFVSPSRLRELNIYTASPSHRFLRVVRTRQDWGDPFHIQGEETIMQLDMEAILRRYEETGVLAIREEPGILQRTLDSISTFRNDISFGLGVDVVSR